MKLNNLERHRILEIFESNEYYGAHNKFEKVCQAAKLENIRISSRGLYKLVNRYKLRGFVRNQKPASSNMLITKRGLLAVNESLLKNSFLTAKKLKFNLVLVASRRTVTRYISKLGWKKIRTR